MEKKGGGRGDLTHSLGQTYIYLWGREYSFRVSMKCCLPPEWLTPHPKWNSSWQRLFYVYGTRLTSPIRTRGPWTWIPEWGILSLDPWPPLPCLFTESSCFRSFLREERDRIPSMTRVYSCLIFWSVFFVPFVLPYFMNMYDYPLLWTL